MCAAIPITGGIAYPKFVITGVTYAPPGCTSSAQFKCNAQSQVQYLTQSTMGTKISISSSVKASLSVTATGGLSIKGLGTFTESIQNSYSVTNTDTKTNSITKAANSVITQGSNGDGVDHDQDQVWLLLNPAVGTAVAYGIVDWSLGFTGDTPISFPLSIAYLKDPAAMPANVQAVVAGFTTDDYKTILAADPFAQLTDPIADSDIDTARFTKSYTLSYQPGQTGAACNNGVCVCPITQNSITNGFATDQSAETIGTKTTNYSVGIKAEVSDGGSPAPTGTLGFTDDASIAFINSSTTTNSTSLSNTAAVTLACPSPTYQGGTLMDIYWDTLYGSFAFVVRDTAPGEQVLYQEHVSNLDWQPTLPKKNKGPLANPLNTHNSFPSLGVVELTYGKKKYRTLPDRDGNVKFYGKRVEGVKTATIAYPGSHSVKTVAILSPN